MEAITTKNIATKTRLLIIGAVFLLVYFLPYIILQENSYILIHDNLDSEVYFNILAAKYFFKFSGKIPEFMNIDVGSLNTFSITQTFFYAFLPPFWAYITNELFVRALAYAGMLMLLSIFFKQKFNKEYFFVTVLVSIVFAALPFYSVYGLTCAGLPMLCSAMYFIYKRRRLLFSFFAVLLFATSSSLFLTGYQVLIALFVLCVRFVIKKETRFKQIPFYLASALIFVVYILLNIKMLMLFSTDFVVHRVTWTGTRGYGYLEFLFLAAVYFLNGRYHAGSYHCIMLAVCVACSIIGAIQKKRHGSDYENHKLVEYVNFSYLANAALLLGGGILLYKPVVTFLGNFGILGSFNFSRTFFLAPLVFYVPSAVALAFIFDLIKQSVKKRQSTMLQPKKQTPHRVASTVVAAICALSFLVSGAIYVVDYSRYQMNYIALFKVNYDENMPTYAQFYDTKLFSKIDDYITENYALKKSDYRVGSIGMFPVVASYNGFYTIDGYCQSYSYDYKMLMRSAISDELAKSKLLDDYFVWGNRCYLFAKDIGQFYLCGKNYNKKININYNAEILKQLNTKFIFSAVEIQNAAQNSFVLREVFETKTSFWRVYLYEIV